MIQSVVRVLPLTAAVDALRGNMLQGMSLGQLVMPPGILTIGLVFPFAISLRIIRLR